MPDFACAESESRSPDRTGANPKPAVDPERRDRRPARRPNLPETTSFGNACPIYPLQFTHHLPASIYPIRSPRLRT